VRGSVMRLVQVKRLDRGSGSTELAEVSPSCPFGRGLIASGYLYVPLNRNGGTVEVISRPSLNISSGLGRIGIHSDGCRSCVCIFHAV
jgi:hypothetical protein